MNLFAAETLAKDLIMQYVPHYRFGWMNEKRTNGRCEYRTRTIRLSRHLTPLRTDAAVRQTIMHEIAHALTQGSGHGREWKNQMRAFGLSPNRCSQDAPDISSIAKYKVVCATHGITGHMHRKPRVARSCGKCSRKYDARYLLSVVPNN